MKFLSYKKNTKIASEYNNYRKSWCQNDRRKGLDLRYLKAFWNSFRTFFAGIPSPAENIALLSKSLYFISFINWFVLHFYFMLSSAAERDHRFIDGKMGSRNPITRAIDSEDRSNRLKLPGKAFMWLTRTGYLISKRKISMKLLKSISRQIPS